MMIISQLKFVSFLFTVSNGIGHCFVLTQPNRGQVLFGIPKKKEKRKKKRGQVKVDLFIKKQKIKVSLLLGMNSSR